MDQTRSPSGFRLDYWQEARTGTGAFILMSSGDPAAFRSMTGSWELRSDDTLVVRWGNGFWGVQLMLKPAGDGFLGEAESLSDIGAGGPYSVRATRVPCEDRAWWHGSRIHAFVGNQPIIQ